ncbi:hypothetical protein QKW52_19845 [Bacillus sonorensis]|nr:hypothetical protein [Bacillus sonorensis]
MKQTFPYIDMRIGRVRANHRLKYKGKEYELKRYIPRVRGQGCRFKKSMFCSN